MPWWKETELEGGFFRWKCIQRKINLDHPRPIDAEEERGMDRWGEKTESRDLLVRLAYCHVDVKVKHWSVGGGAAKATRTYRGSACISAGGTISRHVEVSLSETCVGNLYKTLGCMEGEKGGNVSIWVEKEAGGLVGKRILGVDGGGNAKKGHRV